jgi:DNA polymerase I-like protein with 3'-5' exonuclease and polymerase domains
MNINGEQDVDRLRAIRQASEEAMRKYEEFYAGHDAQLMSNVYYRSTKARVEAVASRINELEGAFESRNDLHPSFN